MKTTAKTDIRALVREIIVIVIGSALYAVGFQFFLYHNAIPTGGVTGLAMILNYLTDLPVGVMTIVMNVPIFIVAWKVIGLRFIIASLVGMGLSSIFVDLFALLPINATTDPMLACLFAGAIKGLGLGLVCSVGATTGGVDIIAKLLRRKYQAIPFGTLILVLDLVIIAVFALIFKLYDRAMYAAIAMFISSKVVDFVLYGATTSKLCYIISDENERVREAIVTKLHRGVTMVKGIGAYSGMEKQVLLCVVKRQEAMELRRLVRESDEKAFLIISDAHDVYGKGFTNLDSKE